MIKTTIEEETKGPEIDYPCLMVSHNGTIVFMTSYRCGTCVFAQGFDALGAYNESWTISNFIPFTGKLIMENEK